MSQVLLIGALMVIGFVVVLLLGVHGEARGMTNGRVAERPHRTPEELTSLELPPETFHHTHHSQVEAHEEEEK